MEALVTQFRFEVKSTNNDMRVSRLPNLPTPTTMMRAFRTTDEGILKDLQHCSKGLPFYAAPHAPCAKPAVSIASTHPSGRQA